MFYSIKFEKRELFKYVCEVKRSKYTSKTKRHLKYHL